ncbi:MAG: heme-binding domain-containing protein [Prolixibacteraceae bacterium]
MKNLNRVSFLVVIASAFLVFTLIPTDGFSQKKTQQETLAVFPDQVSGIFKNSCVGCHSDESRGKGKIFMNFSEWDKLNLKKQVKTGKRIAKWVNKGAMPPAGFLEKRPEAALTPEQIKSINIWAHSVMKNK